MRIFLHLGLIPFLPPVPLALDARVHLCGIAVLIIEPPRKKKNKKAN